MASRMLIGAPPASPKAVQGSELLAPKDGCAVTMQGPVADPLHPKMALWESLEAIAGNDR